MSGIDKRANDAAALKGNALLQEILAQVKSEAVAAWISTPAQGGEPAREFAWMLHKAVGRIESVIQGAIDDKEIAASRATAPLR